MKKAMKILNTLLNFAISAVCLVLANRLVFTYNSLIEPALMILIAIKCSVEVILTV